MVENSRPWEGITTGDAGAYTDDDWTDIWKDLLGALADADTGILSNVLNELEVTGAGTPLSVNTGVALVDGTYYTNGAAVSVAIATPAGATRIDRVVLRKSWAAQTVRITLVAGVEGGGAPALTQVDGTTWDLPLFQASITVGGVVTLTDERERLNTRTPSMTTAQRDAMTAVNGMAIYNETTGEYQVRAAGTWIPVASSLGYTMKPPVVRWVIPGWQGGTGVNQLITANRTYYTPIVVPLDTTYDRIGINVQAGDGAGGLADLRIFENLNGVPGDLVLSAGTVSTNGAGAKEIVIAEALTAGRYFLAIRCDQAPTISSGGGHGPASSIDITNAQFIPSASLLLFDDAAYADPAGATDGVQTSNFNFVRLREA